MSLSRRGPGRVDPAEARERTRDPGGSVLLDVRDAHEWAASHATGVIHLPLTALAAAAALPTPARDRPLVVICRSGNRSRSAAELLTARSLTAVDVTGGMVAWTRAGLPVVHGRGASGSIA
ncbi:rhodanese-like domain-containing protein [Streptomyces sp. NPDC054841]